MKRLLRFLLCLPGLVIISQPLQAQPGWRALIGDDLSGWKQLNGEADYRWEDGMIVGTTVANTPNSFLATEETFGDFILEGEVWFEPTNTGIQFRSLSTPDYRDGRVHGYQMELDPSNRKWSGGIYDEARRGWLYPVEINPPARQALTVEAWNSFRIEAIGPVLRTWINDVPVAHLIDTMTAEGFIALQVHSIGNEEEAGRIIRWRNLRIQTDNLEPRPWDDIRVVNLIPNTLSEQEKAQGWELLFDGKTTTGWRGAHREEFPERGWRVENGELVVEAADGAESGNGGDIVTMGTYQQFEFQLDFMLSEGANSGIKYFITEQYNPDGSAIGLEYQLLDDERHPDARQGTAGNRTLASLYDLIPAVDSKPQPSPGQWQHAYLVVHGTRRTDWPNLSYRHREPEVFSGAFVEHWLDHTLVLRYERGNQAFQALVARSKYADWEGFGQWQSGHLLLQDHGDAVRFRSIKVRRIE